MTSRVRVLLVCVLALVLGACPPPGDRVVEKPKNAPSTGGDKPPASDGGDPATAAGPTGQTHLPDGAPTHPDGADTEIDGRAVIIEHIAGGAAVARCPECGQVQRAGDASCPSCETELAQWRISEPCPTCTGTGDCGRCGPERPCAACSGAGRCGPCGGTGNVGDADCPVCSGRRACTSCGGDGVRDESGREFDPDESLIPGLCPTCLDGSGVCSICGGSGENLAGGICLACDGDAKCADCAGSGKCPHDARDGHCVTCGGSGVVVVNGSAPPRSALEWTVRRTDGRSLRGRVPDMPNPDVIVVIEDGGRVVRDSVIQSAATAHTYYRAVRDHTAVDDADGLLQLAAVALERKLFGAALRDVERAMEADPAVVDRADQIRGDAIASRGTAWLEAARAARSAGALEYALRLARTVEQAGGGARRSAATLAREIEAEREASRRGLGDSARRDAARAANQLVERAVHRSRVLLDDAGDTDCGGVAPGRTERAEELACRRADRAAWQAWLTLARRAHESPDAEWPAEARALVTAAWRLRARIAVDHAADAVRRGRFARGALLAERALALTDASHTGDGPDEIETLARELLDQARLGMAARGVNQTAPPTEDE